MEKEDKIELTRVAFYGSTIVVFIIGLLLATGTAFVRELALLALIAMLLLNANFFHHTGQAKKGRDERLALVANRAMANSWYLSLTAILVLLALEGFIGLGISAEQMLGIAIMVMIATMVIFNETMVRRGEVGA